MTFSDRWLRPAGFSCPRPSNESGCMFRQTATNMALPKDFWVNGSRIRFDPSAFVSIVVVVVAIVAGSRVNSAATVLVAAKLLAAALRRGRLADDGADQGTTGGTNHSAFCVAAWCLTGQGADATANERALIVSPSMTVATPASCAASDRSASRLLTPDTSSSLRCTPDGARTPAPPPPSARALPGRRRVNRWRKPTRRRHSVASSKISGFVGNHSYQLALR